MFFVRRAISVERCDAKETGIDFRRSVFRGRISSGIRFKQFLHSISTENISDYSRDNFFA